MSFLILFQMKLVFHSKDPLSLNEFVQNKIKWKIEMYKTYIKMVLLIIAPWISRCNWCSYRNCKYMKARVIWSIDHKIKQSKIQFEDILFYLKIFYSWFDANPTFKTCGVFLDMLKEAFDKVWHVYRINL